MMLLALQQLINQAQADIDAASLAGNAKSHIEALQRMTIALKMAGLGTDYLRSLKQTQKRSAR